MSKEVRKLFLRKHVLYVVMLISLQLINMLLNYYELFKPIPDNNSRQQVIWLISFTSMLSTGIVMGFIRMYDPIYTFMIKQSMYEWFGEILDEENQGMQG